MKLTGCVRASHTVDRASIFYCLYPMLRDVYREYNYELVDTIIISIRSENMHGAVLL